MKKFSPRTLLHDSFEVGVSLKGLDGILQTLAGLLLFFVRPESLNRAFWTLAQREFLEDPNDRTLNFFAHALQGLSVQTAALAGLVLLFHGLIKIFLVVGLLRQKLWVYPLAIWVQLAFITYQIYQMAYHYSVFLLILTIVDALIIFLIWDEYAYRKTKAAA